MGSTNSMSRENKKKQLKRQIVPSNNQYHEEEDSRDIVHKAHKRVVRKRLTIFLVLVILAAVVALVLLGMTVITSLRIIRSYGKRT